MEKLPWLGVLLLVATISGKGVLDLSGKRAVNGTWKASITLPCTYEPSADFKELSVAWKNSVQDHGLRTIFHRDEHSGDQILLTVFKERLIVQKQPPGDVSLQIKELDMTDSGTYTCSITWEAKNKSRITKERLTTLKVIKVPVTKPVITPSNGTPLVLPEGARISLTCQSQGSPPIRYQWFKEVAGSDGEIKSSQAVLIFYHLERTDAGSYYCVAQNRAGPRKERSDPVRLTVEEGSAQSSTLYPSIKPEEHTTTTQLPTLGPEFEKHTTARTETTITEKKFRARTEAGPVAPRRTTTEKGERTTLSTFGYPRNGSERQGSRKAALPLHIIILIAVLCAVLVLAILSVAFCRRRTKSDHTYEVTYNNNALNIGTGDERPEAACGLHEDTYEEPSRCVENNYTDEPTKGGEYTVMDTRPDNDYEFLVNKMESEYEITDAM